MYFITFSSSTVLTRKNDDIIILFLTLEDGSDFASVEMKIFL